MRLFSYSRLAVFVERKSIRATTVDTKMVASVLKRVTQQRRKQMRVLHKTDFREVIGQVLTDGVKPGYLISISKVDESEVTQKDHYAIGAVLKELYCHINVHTCRFEAPRQNKWVI